MYNIFIMSGKFIMRIALILLLHFFIWTETSFTWKHVLTMEIWILLRAEDHLAESHTLLPFGLLWE